MPEGLEEMLAKLVALPGVCQVWLESPQVLCESHTVPNGWWCHYEHHYPSGETCNDYGVGATPLDAVRDAYEDQSARGGD